MEQEDIETIKAMIAAKAERFRSRMGDVTFAGVEDGTVKIAPSGFCWRWHVTRIALVEGLQKELAERFPWVEKVIVVRSHAVEQGK